jgi:hypothetical protein
LRSRCLLLGSSMLDGQAEANLLLPLFEGLAAYQKWKSEDPQSYISQVQRERVLGKVFLRGCHSGEGGSVLSYSRDTARGQPAVALFGWLGCVSAEGPHGHYANAHS